MDAQPVVRNIHSTNGNCSIAYIIGLPEAMRISRRRIRLAAILKMAAKMLTYLHIRVKLLMPVTISFVSNFLTNSQVMGNYDVYGIPSYSVQQLRTYSQIMKGFKHVLRGW